MQFFGPFLGGFRFPSVHAAQAFQAAQFFQSGVGDGGIEQVEVFKFFQSFELVQSGVGDGGIFEAQALEVGGGGEGGQSGIGHLGATEVDIGEVGREWGELGEGRVVEFIGHVDGGEHEAGIALGELQNGHAEGAGDGGDAVFRGLIQIFGGDERAGGGGWRFDLEDGQFHGGGHEVRGNTGILDGSGGVRAGVDPPFK